MALDRIYTQTTNRPVSFFLSYGDDPEDEDNPGLDLNSDYQRGDVWGLTRRQNLIRSLLIGVPVPAVVINDRAAAKFHEHSYTEARNAAFAVIDGKQRVTTFLMFARDRFGVPAEWLNADDVEIVANDGLVYWSGMTTTARRAFKANSTIGVVETRLATLDDETRVFDLINYGGVAQGDTDDAPLDWSN